MEQKTSWSQDALNAFVCLKVGARLKALQYTTNTIQERFAKIDHLDSDSDEILAEYIDNHALTAGRRIEMQAIQKLSDLNPTVCMIVISGASDKPLERVVPFNEAYQSILKLRAMNLVDLIWYPAFFSSVEEAEEYTTKAVDDYWKRKKIMEQVFSTVKQPTAQVI
jgi:hypothetical protein